MQQLQEKLQMNLIQQTHLVQTADKTKTTDTLHQMALQQQQLVHQLQLTQRQYVLQHGMGIQPAVLPHPQQPKAGGVSSKYLYLDITQKTAPKGVQTITPLKDFSNGM